MNSIIKLFRINRNLIFQLTALEVKDRYKGSFLGLLWSALTPLGMLIIYTFIFSVIIKLKWSEGITGSHVEYAVNLFAGLIIYNYFNDSVLAAPDAIRNNPGYVKKVIFPVEILPVIQVLSSFIHFVINLIIMLGGVFIVYKSIPVSAILLFLYCIPLTFFCLGFSWFFSATGVFISDTGHALRVLMQILFFLTPVCYPLSIIPENFRAFFYLNPLTLSIEQFRTAAVQSEIPNMGLYGIHLLIASIICIGGFLWFSKHKGDFADVI